MPINDAAVGHQFVEQFGLHVENQGMPRIAGRLWAYLLMQKSPCDAESLGEALQISHGSVSTNSRLLEALGIIERVTFPGDRRSYYRISSDPYTAVLTEWVARQRRLARLAQQAAEHLPDTDLARARLDALGEISTRVAQATAGVVEEWVAERLTTVSARRVATPGSGIVS